MKTINSNDLGKKYLVEECQKIRIDTVVRQARKDILGTLIHGMVEIGGIQIGITNYPLHHGGKRLWFVCPLCNQPCGIIYSHPIQKNHIGCRACLNLEYKCRRYKGMLESMT